MKNELLEFALTLAAAAESEIMPRFRACTVDWKPDGSEVTDADRGAEEAMRALIARRFPSHAVLGEEYGGSHAPTNDPVWILDPIDGTASFAVGLPTFGTLIGYMENGVPQLGVIHLPALGETVYAVKGSGCWTRQRDCEAKPARVSAIADLRQAYVSATGSGEGYRLSTLIAKARRFRFIGDCVQHALVAQGRIDVAIDAVMHPWDIAALVPCIEEAGGVVTDLDGRYDGVVWRPHLLSSSSKSLHEEVLRVLRDDS
jgi:histidinol-phosphatase